MRLGPGRRRRSSTRQSGLLSMYQPEQFYNLSRVSSTRRGRLGSPLMAQRNAALCPRIPAADFFEAQRINNRRESDRHAVVREARLAALKLPPPRPPSRNRALRSTYKSPPEELIQKMYEQRKYATQKNARAESSILPEATGRFTYPPTSTWGGQTRFPSIVQPTQLSASFYGPRYYQGHCFAHHKSHSVTFHPSLTRHFVVGSRR